MDVHPQAYVIAYDICDPTRLRKVFKTMRRWGDHLQYSVFRCLLSPRQLAQLKADLEPLIHHTEDQILFIPLGQPDGPTARRLFTLGQPLLYPERIARVF